MALNELTYDDMAVARLPLPPEYGAYYQKWLDSGRQGQMHYLAESAATRSAPDMGRPWAKYAVILAKKLPILGSGAPEPPPELASAALIGSVSLYALGADYHLVLPPICAQFIQDNHIEGQTEITVDSAAVNERALALAAGLARRGRHAGLISAKLGTHFAIGVIFCASLPAQLAQKASCLTAAEAEYPCAKCRRCQAACPVGALGEGGLDGRRCLSYWSIEHRGALPADIAQKWPGIIFGCDLCLRVCPHSGLGNTRTLAEEAALFRAREYISAHSGKALDRAIRGTAYSRARGTGLKRNTS